MDSYFDVQEVYQNTPLAAGVDSFIKNGSGDWKLDKQQTSYNDLLDGLRLACLNYE
jgi:hypothetical protein